MKTIEMPYKVKDNRHRLKKIFTLREWWRSLTQDVPEYVLCFPRLLEMFPGIRKRNSGVLFISRKPISSNLCRFHDITNHAKYPSYHLQMKNIEGWRGIILFDETRSQFIKLLKDNSIDIGEEFYIDFIWD